MRLRQVEIENFGIFRQRSFEFGDGRFHLVYGPNEAGKSTLLALIRELFFGFAVRNSYAFADHSGEMAATALIDLAGGSQVRFRRRKGTKNTVVGQVLDSGQTIDEAGLARLLGSATAELYKHVFGFSLAELTSGEESLKSARLEEALYGGGLGGLANFQRVQAAIQDEHESLFSPARTAKTRTINRLLEQITQATTELNQAMVKPREYKELCERRDACREEEERLRKRRDECHRGRQHVDRLAQALPCSLRLAQARRELAGLEVPEAFPLDAGEEYRRLGEQLAAVVHDLEAAETEIEETTAELESIRLSPEIVAEEPAVKAVFQKVAQARSCRDDIPRRQQEAETIRSRVLAGIVELNPAWNLSHLEQFRTSLAQRERVEQMDEEHRKLQERAVALASQKQEKEKRLADDLRKLDRLRAVEPVPVLEQLAKRAARYTADRDKAADAKAQEETLGAQIRRLEQRLAGPFHLAAESLALLAAPLEATIQEFSRKLAEVHEAVKLATRRRDDARDELAERQEELSRFDAEQSVPDRQRLLAQRDRRDSGWRLIRRKFIEGEAAQDELAAWQGRHSSIPDLYEQEVAEADRLADDRQEKAELVARRDQLAAEAARKKQRLDELERRRTACETQRDEQVQAWNALWASCGLVPQSPEAMSEWERLRRDLLEKLEQRQALESKRGELDRRLGGYEEELRAALGGEGPVEGLLHEAQRRVEESRRAATQREQYESELPVRRQEIDELDEKLDEIGRQQAAWAAAWESVLAEFGFPTDWDVRLAAKILSGLVRARQEYQEVHSLEKRLGDMTGTLSSFEAEVQRLCAQLVVRHASDLELAATGGLSASAEDTGRQAARGTRANVASALPDLSRLPPEEAAIQLNQRLEEAKQAQRQHATLSAQRDRAAKRAAAKRQQREAIERRLEELRQAAGVATDHEFARIAAEALRKRDLSAEIVGLERELERIATGEDQAGFLEALHQSDADALALAQQQAKADLDRAEHEYRVAVQEAALAAQKVEELDGQTRANELVQKIEGDRAELRGAVDRWAPLVLAHALMDQAIQRFEREHQPAMLRDVGRLFCQMTEGRYVGIRRRLDEQGTVLVDQADGASKEPGQLSTGTREQLYLAIRLAYAQHYCRESEPLPLVMDDVLVNFDDARAASTLDVLSQVAEQIQIIFLTCHQGTVDRITARFPAMSPTRLER